MSRRTHAPQLAVLLSLGMAVAACGTLGVTPAKVAKAGAVRGLADPAPPANPLDAGRALAHVAYLTEPALAGRGTATEGDYLADAYIEAEFKKLGLVTAKQAFTSGAFKGTAHNVMAILPGTERSDRYIVVGAHKDHLGKQWGKVYPGANDNAGGTAAVLEIARVMTERTFNGGDRPRSNILFMTYSGEELGLIGSKFYCKNPIAPDYEGATYPVKLDKIAGMVNLDCIAVGNTNTIGTDMADTRERADLTAIARNRGMKTVFKAFSIPEGPAGSHAHAHTDEAGRPLPAGASSDHASFRAAGVRAVCYYAEPVFSKYLHAPEDTIPARDTVKKAPGDRFNVDNLVCIGAIALDTVTKWSNEAQSGR